MSSEVKRYDAVHLRYEDNNIRYGEGCEVEVVTASDYAALEAENARLRVKLMTIASAEPARHGIEWAKAIAAEGNSEPYAKWREAIEERDALAAELAAIKGQEPVGVVYLRKGGGISMLQVELNTPLHHGTKLYTLPSASRVQEGT